MKFDSYAHCAHTYSFCYCFSFLRKAKLQKSKPLTEQTYVQTNYKYSVHTKKKNKMELMMIQMKCNVISVVPLHSLQMHTQKINNNNNNNHILVRSFSYTYLEIMNFKQNATRDTACLAKRILVRLNVC